MILMSNFKNFIIRENLTVYQTMLELDRTARRILFVSDAAGMLVGSITDGDVRRWILRNGALDANILNVINKNPHSIKEGEIDQAWKYMHDLMIDALPVLDDLGRIIDVLFKDESINTENNKESINCPVVIMAGGLGTRLYPYTKILPKALVPIGDVPIIEHIINRFEVYGCKDFYLVVNHKKNMIKSYFDDLTKDYNVFFIEEDKPLGTAGGLSLLKGIIEDTFILTNCDILIDVDFGSIMNEHKKSKNDVTMVCSIKEFEIPYGVIEVDSEGYISKMSEKPKTSYLINTGCYIVEPSVVNVIEDGVSVGFPDVIHKCQTLGMTAGIYPIVENNWYDMGQLDELKKMEEIIGK